MINDMVTKEYEWINEGKGNGVFQLKVRAKKENRLGMLK